ncbi:MAG: hypothetical protein CO170_00735 [candidate division SR1 bacterium CG_4_9_14_3_um_filter_40_9]|nr:MAG: hypothetical protein CO170_00735 [candidate division SR1 bacterium CG_4_9_14_3_um_filter_40_9]
MADTAQLNIRIPVSIKSKAQDKAEKIGTNLNFLIKMFLSKFIMQNDIVTFQQDIHTDKIFDQGTKEYFMSKESKKTTQQINKHLEQIVKNGK